MGEKSNGHSEDEYAERLLKTGRLLEGAIRQAIRALQLEQGSVGLDAGCGIGTHTFQLGEAVGPGGKVTGLDISPAFLDLARKTAQQSGMSERLDFQQGNMLDLPFEDNTFDWVWCKDSLWPGLGKDPVVGLKEFARVVRPGGIIAVLYGSSQMLLPGYPELEARLMVAFTKTVPYLKGVRPDRHFLRALGWMQSVGLQDIGVRSFAADAYAPLAPEIRDAIDTCFQMFFGNLEPHVSKEDWDMFQKLCNPESDDYLLKRPDYYCFLNYSMFYGQKTLEVNRMGERLIVIGGCAAGMSAASKARRLNPDLEIIVYEKTGFVSYASCGLPYYVSGLIEDHNKLVVRTPAQFAKRGIEVHLHHKVTEVDTENRRVRVTNLEDGRSWYKSYDKLVIATGGRPTVLPGFSLGDLSGVFIMRAVEDGVATRGFVQHERPRRAVIIGAGYIGVEMAESFHELGLETTIIGRPPQVLKRFALDMAQLVQDELESKGIRLSLGDEVKALEGDAQGRVRRVISSKGAFEADLVLLAMGVRPNVALAETASVALGETGAIATDSQMCTNLPDVFAAGDCAEAYHRITGRGAYIPLATTANKQGRVAGTNLGGGHAQFEGIVGTVITKVLDVYAALAGLAEKEARALGYAVQSTTIQAGSRAHYYPGGRPMHVKLVVEEGSGRLLGGQIVGDEGAGPRIDVLATALHKGMTGEELSGLDLAYVPPIAPVWDPLLVAANVALKA